MPVKEEDTMSDFTVTGTRPPSARERPRSATRSKNLYHKVGSTSTVDETLFGKPLAEPSFPSPWGKEKKQQILMWAPPSQSNDNESARSVRRTPRKSTDKFRMVKHKESYVDELLFGPQPVAPSFKAPWERPTERVEPHLGHPLNYSERVRAEKRLNQANTTQNGLTLNTRPLSREDFRPRSSRPNSSRPASGRLPLKATNHLGKNYWCPPSGTSSTATSARPAWR